MQFQASTIGVEMRVVLASLILLFLLLQYVLWLGDFSYLRLSALDSAVAAQEDANVLLEKRNERLRAEVVDLKRGTDALEERARVQLGMIKEGEIFFQIVESGLEGSVVQPITR
jgi:cell division protein FtsB